MPDGYLPSRKAAQTKPLGLNSPTLTLPLSNPTTSEIKEIASNAAIINGFEVIEIHMLTNKRPLSIQVQVRHRETNKQVNIDDCALLSQPIYEAIQSSYFINEPFTLEISSEGIDEFLIDDRDFQTFKGFPVEVTFQDFKKVEQQKKGLLLSKSEDDLEINQKGKIQRIPVKDVIQVRLTTSSA